MMTKQREITLRFSPNQLTSILAAKGIVNLLP
jgi:hypothetical protein